MSEPLRYCKACDVYQVRSTCCKCGEPIHRESSDELFTLPPSPAPELAAARRRLLDAEIRLHEIEADGTDDLGIATEAAESELRLAQTDVLRLEKAELEKLK